MQYWHGERVRLRALESTDAGVLYLWNKDSERSRQLALSAPPPSYMALKSWVDWQAHKGFFGDTYTWMIEDTASTPVGMLTTAHCDLRNGTFSYTIGVAPEYQRRGYAREAIQLVLKFYFMEGRYQKVTVPVHSDNAASIGLHEQLGFAREGVLRRVVYTQGNYIDAIYFGMTAEEFLKAHVFST